jgi:hypothetical protein
MRQLTDNEKSLRQDLLIGLCQERQRKVAEQEALRKKANRITAAIKEDDRNISTVSAELLSGETEEQPTLPMQG